MGTYDVVVNGGGLIGLAAAVGMAREGAHVALVERRSTFGWEVGRARRVFVDLEAIAPYSSLAGEWQATLREWSGLFDGRIDPVLSELIFDEWIMESGVDPYLHAWGIEVSDNGLVVGVKEGYRTLRAPVVIETDEPARLVPDSLRQARPQQAAIRSLILAGALLGEECTTQLTIANEHIDLRLRPLGQDLVQIDLALPQDEYGQRERFLAAIVREIVLRLRQEVPGLEDATLALVGDDEWQTPAIEVRVAGLTKGAVETDAIASLVVMEEDRVVAQPLAADTVPVVKGPVELILAGPWIATVLEYCGDERVGVLNRLLLGELAARLALRHVRVGALSMHTDLAEST